MAITPKISCKLLSMAYKSLYDPASPASPTLIWRRSPSLLATLQTQWWANGQNMLSSLPLKSLCTHSPLYCKCSAHALGWPALLHPSSLWVNLTFSERPYPDYSTELHNPGYSPSQHSLGSFHSIFLTLLLYLSSYLFIFPYLERNPYGQRPLHSSLRIQYRVSVKEIVGVFNIYLLNECGPYPGNIFYVGQQGPRRSFRKYLVRWSHDSMELSQLVILQRNCTTGFHSEKMIYQIPGNIQEYYFY